MNVNEVAGPAEFLQAATLFLLRHEAIHCILLGIPGDFVRYGGGKDARFWVVRDDRNAVAGAAMLTPTMSVAVSLMSDEAVADLAEGLAKAQPDLPGVIGPVDVSDRFDARWRRLTGATSQVVAAGQHCWELITVEDVLDAAGEMVIADESDLASLAPWSADAAVEFGNTIEQWEAQTRRACERRQLFLWRNGEPVASAMLGGQTPNGIRVSGVFTPPKRRRRGYATSLVAAMSRQALSQGRTRCFLFTDTRNATAEGVYARIGYRRVGTISHHRFV